MTTRNIFRKGKWASFATLLLSVLLSFTALAEGSYYVDSAPIRFQVSHSKDAPEAETYRVVLEADKSTPDAPMPKISQMDVEVKPGEEVDISEAFGDIHYTKPGIYSYLLYQEPGSTPRVIYDRTRYIITVEVRNADSVILESGKEEQLIARFITCVVEGSGQKLPDPSFVNGYDKPEETTPPETSGSGGGGSSGGGDSGGAVTPVSPGTFGPGVIGDVLGAVRESPVVEAISRIPQVLGAARGSIATGDESSAALYAILAGLSLAGLAALAVRRLRRKSL